MVTACALQTKPPTFRCRPRVYRTPTPRDMASGGKRRRLSTADADSLVGLLHLGGVSVVTLSKLIERLQTLDLEDGGASRKNLGRMNQELYMKLRVVIDMPMQSGKRFLWELINPNLMLTCMAETSLPFGRLLATAIQRQPPTHENPWRLVIAFDEYTPGQTHSTSASTFLSPAARPQCVILVSGTAALFSIRCCVLCAGSKLQLDKSRSSMVLSYSYLELGQRAMTLECGWLTPVVLRHNYMEQVVGGWPHFVKRFLELQLLSPCGLATAGVPVTIAGKTTIIWARLANVLADGEGLMKVWDWKGASSLHGCIKHHNVWKKVHKYLFRGGRQAAAKDIVLGSVIRFISRHGRA